MRRWRRWQAWCRIGRIGSEAPGVAWLGAPSWRRAAPLAGSRPCEAAVAAGGWLVVLPTLGNGSGSGVRHAYDCACGHVAFVQVDLALWRWRYRRYLCRFCLLPPLPRARAGKGDGPWHPW
eukprot:13490619-Alexandrium_andersonii.AAC.1